MRNFLLLSRSAKLVRRSRWTPPNAIMLAMLLCSAAIPGQGHAETEAVALTRDQQAIVARIARPSGGAGVRYAAASSDPIGAEVRLPFGEGRFINLVRKASVSRADGSISWHGEVEQTGERAVLDALE